MIEGKWANEVGVAGEGDDAETVIGAFFDKVVDDGFGDIEAGDEVIFCGEVESKHGGG